MRGVFYCTREAVKAALDIKLTARSDAQVDDAIEGESRAIEDTLHRRFYPEVDTRSFDWPNYQYAPPWRLWLDGNELISVTSLTAGGVVIPEPDRLLRRADDRDEPPYDHIEIDLSSSAAFSSGDTHQQSIVITGLWGHSNVETPAGALAEVLDGSETEVDVTNSAAVGVGDIVRADAERMIVTGKAMIDTGQNASALTASTGDVAITSITAGTVHAGEVILVDSERMLVVDVAGTTLTVKRAWDGTVLAAHSGGDDILALRRLTVERGALGTTATTHSDALAIVRHVVPGTVRALCRAESLNTLLQEQSGYARTTGSGDNEREASGRGLTDIRKRAYAAFGRKARIGAI